MFEKDMNISFLLDFYGDVLSDKQRTLLEYYYNEDLSLAEIAENEGISRQGVRHTIKRAEEQLRFYEEKLGLAAHFADIREKAEEIGRLAASLSDDRDETVRDAAEKIAGAAEKIVSIF